MPHSPREFSRRSLLQAGALGAGLSLSQFLRLSHAAPGNDAGRSGILIFLQGGPSHQDMFDLKPNAPAEYRGEFRPIQTTVPGVEICEHLPKLAKLAHRYAVIRGISHNLADHGLGTRYVMTGNRPNPLLKHPTFGSVVSREFPAREELPTHVAIDHDPEGPGFLGVQHGALSTGEHPRPGRPFEVRGITLGDGITLRQFQARNALAGDLDNAFRGYDQLDEEVRGLDRFSRQARAIIGSPRTRAAFDLTQESPTILQRFGSHEHSHSYLLACRLIEAGVRFVTVLVDGWDTHNANFTSLQKTLLPGFDQGLSALLETLEEKGLLSTTSVLVTGEFGRTPKINGGAGRDHWARAMFALLAGAGAKMGSVTGQTDAHAAEPDGVVYTPDDLAATYFHALGISPTTEYQTEAGRPITLVRDGRVIRDAIA
ncbi:MAG: DUF1501 domain-containing protein [Pirellulaceae bacterium]|nr:DUF1501 domain-containing protein [Pirellulaceae bacterium]